MAYADGSIMPVIITAHIAHSSTRWGASHSGVIIQALMPAIEPYMSRAAATSQIQETSGSRISSAIHAVLAADTGGPAGVRREP